MRRTGDKKKFCPQKDRKYCESQIPEDQVPGPGRVRVPEPATQTQSPTCLKELIEKITKEFVWTDVQGRFSLVNRQRTEAKLIGETKIKYH